MALKVFLLRKTPGLCPTFVHSTFCSSRMHAPLLRAHTRPSRSAAALSLLAAVFVVVHAHDPGTPSATAALRPPMRARQSRWLSAAEDAVPYQGYTSPDWRRCVYDKNCTDALLMPDVKIVGDESCATSNALFLLLRQSSRFNKAKWADDMKDAEFRLNRTMYAHELAPSGSRRDFVLQYTRPSTSCMVWASNVTDTSMSPRISSVSVFKTDMYGVTFAMFSAPTSSSTFLQARVNAANHSVALSFANARGLHRLKNHAPSAAFLPSENLAVANFGWNDYDVALYATKGDAYVNMKMQSPYRAGGENIGSLFRSASSLHTSVRFNVPYVPRDRTGHGYRSIGLYNITDASTGLRSDLIDWVSPDACMSGCLREMHEPCGGILLLLNATLFLRCLPSDGFNIHRNSGDVLKNVYAPCLRSALNVASAPYASSSSALACMDARKESLVNGMLCAQRCRAGNQIYMPAISYMQGSWYGVAGLTSYEAVETGNKDHSQGSNPLLLCRLSKSFAWSPSCFDESEALMLDSYGKLGHPLTSQVVELNGSILLASVGDHASILPKTERCTTYLHSWPASNFSYFRAAEATSKSFKVPLPGIVLPDNAQFSVLYGFDTDAAPCSDGIVLQAFYQNQCRTARIGGNVFTNNNTGDVRFQVNCAPNASTVDLHIHVPSSCYMYGVGP